MPTPSWHLRQHRLIVSAAYQQETQRYIGSSGYYIPALGQEIHRIVLWRGRIRGHRMEVQADGLRHNGLAIRHAWPWLLHFRQSALPLPVRLLEALQVSQHNATQCRHGAGTGRIIVVRLLVLALCLCLWLLQLLQLLLLARQVAQIGGRHNAKQSYELKDKLWPGSVTNRSLLYFAAL